MIETAAPTGYDLASPVYQHVVVVADETVEKTFVNPRQRGAILVTKTRKHAADGPGDHPHAGVTFTVNGQTGQTDANGQVCFDGLLFGTYYPVAVYARAFREHFGGDLTSVSLARAEGGDLGAVAARRGAAEQTAS